MAGPTSRRWCITSFVYPDVKWSEICNLSEEAKQALCIKYFCGQIEIAPTTGTLNSILGLIAHSPGALFLFQ